MEFFLFTDKNFNHYSNSTQLKITKLLFMTNRFEKNFEKVTGINFNTFYKDQYQKLIYYLNGWTKDSELSEDIADEAFIQCLKKVDKYDPKKSQVHTWLFTVARNMAIKNWKDGNKLPTISMDKDVKNNATLEMFLPYNDSIKELERHELIRRKSAYVKRNRCNVL